MKISCYDKYHKQKLIISFPDDKIDISTTSSLSSWGNIYTEFSIDGEGEDPGPERWSDLTDFKIIKED